MKRLGSVLLVAVLAMPQGVFAADLVKTRHKIVIDGRPLSYEATAGYLDLKAPRSDSDENDGLKTIARLFYVAYTADAAEKASRPVTFVFNGGPGSSAIWLHMGGIGPRRARLSEEGDPPAPPYQLANNEDTWLTATDLVFVDPVSTGFSRYVPGEDPSQFFGYTEDARTNAEFVYRYVTREQRWLSPKFIAAESYGSARAAGMAQYLQHEHGLYLNGLMLISPLMMANLLYFTPLNDEPYIAFLPTYATIAWYHRKLPAELQAMSVQDVATLVRAYAREEFTQALRQGGELSEARRRKVASDLERFTGIDADYYAQRQLRVPAKLFLTQLLKAEGFIAGRFDGRYRSRPYHPATEVWTHDPANEAMFGPVSATFNDYLRSELGFVSERAYKRYGGVTQPWGRGDPFEGGMVPAEDLRKTMLRNPYLQVWITSGYYDLATPFLAAETSVRAMNLPDAIRDNIRFTYYESGHSLYVRQESRRQLRADLDAFLGVSLQQPLVPMTQR